MIANKPISTRDWSPSLNPANHLEVIGHAGEDGRRPGFLRRDDLS